MREKARQETSLIYFRHGTPAFPKDQLYDETRSPGLAPQGRSEAEALARWLKGKGREVSALYVSPTTRTRETAEPISQALGLKPEVAEAFQERAFGAWEGMAFTEIEAHDTERYAAWKTDPVRFRPPGGESIGDLAERVGRGLEEVLRRHPGGLVLIVTHVGPIRVSVARALEMPLAHYRRLTIQPGSATRVNYGTTQHNLIYLGCLPFAQAP